MKKDKELNTKKKSDFPPGYGIFPYIIVKVGHAKFIQLPIQRNAIEQTPNKACVFISEKEQADYNLKRKHNLDALRRVQEEQLDKYNSYLPMCLVEGPEDAIYADEQGKTSENSSIPKGGVLLTGNQSIISLYGPHFHMPQ